MTICIVGKKGSKSCKEIRREVGLRLYKGGKASAIVNYGLAGRKLEEFLRRYPAARNIPMLNKQVGRAKHRAIADAESAGIKVPETRMSLPLLAKKSDWIEKKIHSSQGAGIIKARGRRKILGKYYQRMVQDRLYELRVHAFCWMPKESWAIHKRIGPADQIAWNFHQGGTFQTVNNKKARVFVEAQNIAEKVLENRKMQFGAVDLIVDTAREIYFIEINSSPGFTELSQGIYCEAFNALKEKKITGRGASVKIV